MKAHPFIEAEKAAGHGVVRACRLLEVSRAAYYQRRAGATSPRAAADAVLSAKITDIHGESKGTYGSPRVHQALRRQDISCGKRRVARLMRAAGLEGRRKKRWRTTTIADPAAQRARDLIQRDFAPRPGVVLRTHTSPVQIRTMTGRTPPFRFIAPGRVYRHDAGPRNSPMFSQVEGFLVDEQVTFADLKGVLYAFARHVVGQDVKLRFRASYFQFTEPSAELDFSCVLCNQQGCATCSQTGWIEWGGCGMIHPKVLENCGIDSERWQGFAFGMGMERAAMMRHNVPQIRLLYEPDMRILEQL